ncbi:MAG TPA: acetyl-CoA carboxylase biotin carboxylase subunit [Bacillota bacterium]|nr:acetyl-CoA carboxylase biotin carboxylase subunit [Bacillota bacterium]
MIRKILVANRGEIAARIIRTCNTMNIDTVAIYSEADREAAFVSMATEAFEIGPPRPQESYLHMDRIFEIANKSGADAIHPGYGFLSENPAFAQRCEEEGIVFIGPPSSMIALMGDKIAAREAMKDAGIPIIPGTTTALNNEKEAIQEAERIGYPLMVKAAAGGGGVGMEIVQTDEQLLKAIDTNQKRAESLFGDGTLFLEKHIEHAKHIEIQVVADTFGNVIHLFDRECSIQRRNQKVIEEAPSQVPEEVRLAMGEKSVEACKQLGYENVGTIEFLVDENNKFYFLEMNTRIQVEHPVTEEITGLDLIQMQINIAQGEKLPIVQEDVSIQGHAIEVRIYAENPETFFPSPGQITTCEFSSSEKVRLEMSVTEDSKVTPFYDPMIGKMIVKGSTRKEAISILREALSHSTIEGIQTNIPMLEKVLQQDAFIKGNITTKYIQEHIQS